MCRSGPGGRGGAQPAREPGARTGANGGGEHVRPFVRAKVDLGHPELRGGRRSQVGGEGAGALLGGGMLHAHQRRAARGGAVGEDEPGCRFASLPLGPRPWQIRAGFLQGVAERLPSLVACVAAAHERAGELVGEAQVVFVRVVGAVAERVQGFGELPPLTDRASELGAGAPASRARVDGGLLHTARVTATSGPSAPRARR